MEQSKQPKKIPKIILGLFLTLLGLFLIVIFLSLYGVNPIFLIVGFLILPILWWRVWGSKNSELDFYLLERTTFWKLLASTYTGLAAVITLAFRTEILNSTKSWMSPVIVEFVKANISFIVLFYWISLIVWVVIYYFFVSAESKKSKMNSDTMQEHISNLNSSQQTLMKELSEAQNRLIQAQHSERKKTAEENKALNEKINESYTNSLRDLDAAIHYAPNKKVFSEYFEQYSYICNSIDQYECDKSERELSLKYYDTFFTKILSFIRTIVSVFSRKELDIIGANLMVYIDSNGNQDVIHKLKSDQEQFIYFNRYEMKYFRGVLRSIPELIVSGNPDRKIPPLTLPVLHTDDESDRIPGACQAYRAGWTIVHDIQEFEVSREHIQKVSKKLFEGKAKGIKSIISFNIPKVKKSKNELETHNFSKQVGVLNIDCSEPYPLGDKQYRYDVTLNCLIAPIARMLSQPLEEYAKLYLTEFRKDIDI
jgi:hypothetical protein